jgi:hypothetical protein
MRIFSALLIVVMLAATAVAADVNGRWIAQMKAPNGSVSERIFTFKLVGDKLTGTIANRSVAQVVFQETGKKAVTGTLKSQAIPAQDVLEPKINGNEITFVVNLAQGIKNVYTGKISGDEISFTIETKFPEGYVASGAPGGAPPAPPKPIQIVAKRAPATD